MSFGQILPILSLNEMYSDIMTMKMNFWNDFLIKIRNFWFKMLEFQIKNGSFLF